MSFVRELKRRNVFRVGVAYLIIGWLLLQVSDTLAPALHLPEWFQSGVALLLILGFPLALFFAWAFELTPDGLKKEKDIERDQSITPVTGRKLDFLIIGLLTVALGYFAYDKFVASPPAPQDSINSIAVMPRWPTSDQRMRHDQQTLDSRTPCAGEHVSRGPPDSHHDVARGPPWRSLPHDG